MLKQNVADNKPLIDKLNKMGPVLAKLVGEEDAQQLQDLIDADNERFNTIRSGVCERTNTLNETLQQSSEVRKVYLIFLI